MGTVVFNPCYSSPSFFSTSFQFRRQPKLGAPIFFLKGIADGSQAPRFKVSCRILDENTRPRPPKKISLRGQTPQVKDNDALVKQVQSWLRKETPDKKTSKEETTLSPNKRKPKPGPLEKKSPAAAFLENHLLPRKQEKVNGALTELFQTKEKVLKKRSVLDSILDQRKRSQTVVDTKQRKSQVIEDVKKSQPVVDLKSTRPRSKFVRRSPIPRPLVKEEKIEEELVSEALPVIVAAKTEEETELPTLDKMKVNELRLLAKSRGVKVYYKLKKKELLEILKSQE